MLLQLGLSAQQDSVGQRYGTRSPKGTRPLCPALTGFAPCPPGLLIPGWNAALHCLLLTWIENGEMCVHIHGPHSTKTHKHKFTQRSSPTPPLCVPDSPNWLWETPRTVQGREWIRDCSIWKAEMLVVREQVSQHCDEFLPLTFMWLEHSILPGKSSICCSAHF